MSMRNAGSVFSIVTDTNFFFFSPHFFYYLLGYLYSIFVLARCWLSLCM